MRITLMNAISYYLIINKIPDMLSIIILKKIRVIRQIICVICGYNPSTIRITIAHYTPQSHI